MKNFGHKTISFFKKHFKTITLLCIFTVLNLSFIILNFTSNNLKFGKTLAAVIIFSIIVEACLIAFLYYSKRKNFKTETIFLWFGLIIGLLYVFAIPIGRAPDEESHFFRVYELSHGVLVSNTNKETGLNGSTGPLAVDTTIRNFSKQNTTYREVFEKMNTPINDEETTFIATSASAYSLLNYLPQTAGMTLGNIFNFPYILSSYIAKIFHLVTCILIIYFSIKHIPFYKKFIFLTAFLPSSMQAMASLSADGLIIASSIALFSFVLYATYTLKTRFTKKQLLLALTICILLSSGKIVYGLFCLLLFTIPKERFGGKNRKLITIILMGAITLLITLGWFLLKPASPAATDTAAQMALLLQHPLKFGGILLHSLSDYLNLYIGGTLGQYLEWFNITLSPIYITLSFIIVILLCLEYRLNYTINKWFKYITTFSSIIVIFGTFLFMFLTWTKPGETLIDGVQGRYFLPILIALPIAFTPISNKKPTRKSVFVFNNYYLFGFIVFESIYAITTIACTHF